MPRAAIRPGLGILLLGSTLSVPPGCHRHASPGPSVEEDRDSDVPASDAPADPEPSASEDAAQADRAQRQVEVEATARRITDEVARARGLAVTGEFAVELIDKPGVRAFVREAMYEELTRDEVLLFGRIEAALGVLPVGSDGEQVLLDLYELGVLGIYDPKRKTLLIGDYIGAGELGRVIGHEGAHGLQDMHFDLETLAKVNKGRSDLDTAKTFLIEGDAEATYLAWMSGSEGLAAIGDDLLALQADMVLSIDETMIPHPTLTRKLQMPYTEGTASMVRLARDQGFAAIDALYADMPTTSEQLLHADKLAKREPALPVTIDASALLALAADHREVWQDEIGEAGLLAMLAAVEQPGIARKAAAGWGGDRFVVLDRQTDPAAAPLLVGVIAWDSDADAKEFEPSFRAYLDETKPGDHFIQRRGREILYATHFAAALADQADPLAALGKAGWASVSVGKPAKSKPKSKKPEQAKPRASHE
ncbi:hypothetical protein ACNOYE_25580 [Nannocystaceae bacterium ST9]